ncbi:LAETG motif-containing sortase-dependent surface protein [Kitasatospora phosalacinea]|uniref:Gram-positive cocci surface proteins LPxTG domain-containing protein n=1 Tax=Kitasatospora phosalacinea TaxID=2065 RepID=A0A9W6PG36_9ACTN|nr:LAETG motif-containing sortase-dependent surface protein [Kitasatospora phosalacinea]GLW54334.1 hypothetical protein Kpho01_23450 [Kitasatospora phosalacinea]
MSVRTRRARLASFAAVVVLGATVPVLTGASSAWACGDEPAAAAAAGAPAAQPSAVPAVAAEAQSVTAAVLPMTESQITAGGAPVEFGVEVFNPGPGAVKGIAPFLTFHNGAGNGIEGNLAPKDLVLQVVVHGEWKTVPLAYGCDVVLHADTSFLATDLDAVRATRLLFRLSVVKQDAAQTRVDVSLAAVHLPSHAPLGGVTNFALPIVQPAAPTASASATATRTPTASASATATKTPATPAASASTTARAVVPAAAVSSAAVSPSAVPVAANLASTGGGSSSTPMLIGGTALVLLGAGAVVFARRRAAAARG